MPINMGLCKIVLAELTWSFINDIILLVDKGASVDILDRVDIHYLWPCQIVLLGEVIVEELDISLEQYY